MRQPERPPSEQENNEVRVTGSSSPDIECPETVEVSYRRPKLTVWIAAMGAVVAVAAIYFGISMETRIRRIDSQLARMSDGRSLARQGGIETDQQAWVGLVGATLQPLTSDGGGFTITLQNTGKTAALDLQISDVVTIEDRDQSAGLHKPNITAHCSAGTLMPGAMYTTNVWFRTSSDAVSGLTHDQLRAVNFIRITYKDVFQQSNAADACFYWRSSLPGVKPCEGYNELN